MDWHLIATLGTGPLTALILYAAVSWVKDKSRSAAREEFAEKFKLSLVGQVGLAVKEELVRQLQGLLAEQIRRISKEEFAEQIRMALAEHTEALFLRINGTYRRQTECELIGKDVDRRLVALERWRQGVDESSAG